MPIIYPSVQLFLAIFCWILATSAAYGQVAEHRYLVYFADKAGTPHSLDNPESYLSERAIARRLNQGISADVHDLPVSPIYLNQVSVAGDVRLMYPVKWLNAVLIETEDQEALQAIASMEWVAAVEASPVIYLDDCADVDFEPNSMARASDSYGAALNQIEMINGLGLHADGYRGEGMMIGVFDGGFAATEAASVLTALTTSGRIRATVNFVDENEEVFVRSNHGTRVLSTMAAFAVDTMIGTAPEADYLLFITEDVAIERRIEEVLWIVAAEYADSMGVDVINTSLGYTVFDLDEENYTYADMDGQTTLITRGSDRAASRGILIVTSAGNQGSQPWFYISAPADGDSVLAVGAVNAGGQAAAFSSRGPSYDGRVKPNVMAQGQGTTLTDLSTGTSTGNGTSFSAPIISGMAASLWQAHPEATAWQVHQAIEASAHLFQMPNDSMGFGIPDFELARSVLAALSAPVAEMGKPTGLHLYPNPFMAGPLVLAIDNAGKDPVWIEVYSLSGRVIYRSARLPARERFELDRMVSGIGAGVYLVAVHQGGEARITKLVVQ